MPAPTGRYRLADMTFEEAKILLARGAAALLPTGATEAHGPHLPLGTDVIIAEAAAMRAAQRLDKAGVASAVLPPVAYAVTEYASEFSGTVSVDPDTARAILRGAIKGARRAGFREILVCNAHLEPAQIGCIKGVVAEAQAEGIAVAFPDITRKPHALRLGEEFKSGACHAGSYETSLVMAATPFLVRRALAEGLPDNPVSLSTAIREGKKTFLEAGGPRAYFGAPAAATEADGDQLYDELAAIFADEVLRMREGAG